MLLISTHVRATLFAPQAARDKANTQHFTEYEIRVPCTLMQCSRQDQRTPTNEERREPLTDLVADERSSVSRASGLEALIPPSVLLPIEYRQDQGWHHVDLTCFSTKEISKISTAIAEQIEHFPEAGCDIPTEFSRYVAFAYSAKNHELIGLLGATLECHNLPENMLDEVMVHFLDARIHNTSRSPELASWIRVLSSHDSPRIGLAILDELGERLRSNQMSCYDHLLEVLVQRKDPETKRALDNFLFAPPISESAQVEIRNTVKSLLREIASCALRTVPIPVFCLVSRDTPLMAMWAGLVLLRSAAAVFLLQSESAPTNEVLEKHAFLATPAVRNFVEKLHPLGY